MNLPRTIAARSRRMVRQVRTMSAGQNFDSAMMPRSIRLGVSQGELR